jgi:hypothetical protein
MVELTIEADGVELGTITATEGHPFWAPDLQKWVNAGDLVPESMLRTSAGTFVQVSATKKWTTQDQHVYNLTVDGLHTYYVLAGSKPVLVHNCPGLAKLNYYPGVGRSGHFSIEVIDETGFEHMHLMPYNGTAMVGRVPAEGLPAPSMSHTFDLPDAAAAMEHMRSQMGNQGTYNALSNSCLTFCTKTLVEGGVDAPTDKAAIPWIKRILSGG